MPYVRIYYESGHVIGTHRHFKLPSITQSQYKPRETSICKYRLDAHSAEFGWIEFCFNDIENFLSNNDFKNEIKSNLIRAAEKDIDFNYEFSMVYQTGDGSETLELTNRQCEMRFLKFLVKDVPDPEDVKLSVSKPPIPMQTILNAAKSGEISLTSFYEYYGIDYEEEIERLRNEKLHEGNYSSNITKKIEKYQLINDYIDIVYDSIMRHLYYNFELSYVQEQLSHISNDPLLTLITHHAPSEALTWAPPRCVADIRLTDQFQVEKPELKLNHYTRDFIAKAWEKMRQEKI